MYDFRKCTTYCVVCKYLMCDFALEFTFHLGYHHFFGLNRSILIETDISFSWIANYVQCTYNLRNVPILLQKCQSLTWFVGKHFIIERLYFTNLFSIFQNNGHWKMTVVISVGQVVTHRNASRRVYVVASQCWNYGNLPSHSTLFWQKFRESKGFTKKATNELISRNIFMRVIFSLFFTLCVAAYVVLYPLDYGDLNPSWSLLIFI